jgi:hypothetical protein
LFGEPSVPIRREELRVRTDHVTADGGFLVTQCGLQPIGRRPGRLDFVDELAGHMVGAVEQQRTGKCADQHQHADGTQHQHLPALHGQGRAALFDGLGRFRRQ